MCELDRLARLVNGPLARISNFVGAKLAKRSVVRPAKSTHADLDERVARLGFVVAESAGVGEELLYWSGDRVVKLWVVAIKPLPKIAVPVPFQAGNHSRPVKARRAVIACLWIWQVELRANLSVGNFGLWELPECQACH